MLNPKCALGVVIGDCARAGRAMSSRRMLTTHPWTANDFTRCELPSSAEEGWLRAQEETAKPPLNAQTGWCWPEFPDQHHPVRFNEVASRLFLDVAATPPRLRRGVPSVPLPQVPITRDSKPFCRLKPYHV